MVFEVDCMSDMNLELNLAYKRVLFTLFTQQLDYKVRQSLH